jgi:hypothetical protein
MVSYSYSKLIPKKKKLSINLKIILLRLLLPFVLSPLASFPSE